MYRECPVPVAIVNEAARRDHAFMARLVNSVIYRDYQQAFQTTIGMPLTMHAAGSVEAPRHNAKETNPFCVIVATETQCCSGSRQLQRWTEAGANGETGILECYAGLSESAVPIRLGERVVGFLRTGQVLSQAPSNRRFRGILRQMRVRRGDLDVAQLRIAYFATCVISKQHYAAVLRLLAIFAQHLATLGNQLMIAELAAESPSIAKARRFIAAHCSEVLSLADVAHAVHLSPFYFCRKFKRETGLTFTRFLARIRIEEVKQSLLRPHIRITEAAFEAGFQSVSQFNRAFRHVVGESPSVYRNRFGHPARVSVTGPRLAA